MVVTGLGVFLVGIAVNSFAIPLNMRMIQPENNILKAAEDISYTETVDGVEWSYKKDFRGATFVCPVNKDSLPDEVVVPDKLGGIPVTYIGSNAFSETKVKSIVLPDTVDTIDSFAFADCSDLTTIKFPKNPLSVAYEGAFKNCKAVTDISIRRVYESAFEGCRNLRTVTIPKEGFTTFVELSSRSFKDCTSLEEVTIDGPLHSLTIGSFSFEGCTSLQAVHINASEMSLGKFAFSDCRKLSDIAFKGKVIGKVDAFKNCIALTSLTFDETATLANGSFRGCTSLENVTFNGNAIATFSSSANTIFEGCSSLKKVTFNGEKADVTFDQNVAVEEIIYNDTETISGGIDGTNTLKKLAFHTKNPDLERYIYYGNGRVTIEGYRENGKNAALAGHDTVYRWVEANHLTASFISLGTFEDQTDATGVTLPVTASSITLEPIGQVYCVDFDANGGVVNGVFSKLQHEVIYGQTYGTLKPATRKGYIFKGWFTQKTGGERITEDTKVTLTQDSTLYAQWNKVSVAQGKIGKLTNRRSKRFTVAIKKVSGAEGYEVLYSDSKNFAGINQKTLSASETSCTTPKLTKGQTYYVKVRVYKHDSTGNKIYGKYSPVKKIKIRK